MIWTMYRRRQIIYEIHTTMDEFAAAGTTIVACYVTPHGDIFDALNPHIINEQVIKYAHLKLH